VSSRFDNSTDINSFLYASGLESNDILVVKWLFNRNYVEVGWKEDSFIGREWRPHELFGGTIVPDIVKDGNVMSLSYDFTPGKYLYYYHTTSVNVSTDDYPYLIIRWKSPYRPVAVSNVYFETETSYEIVSVGSRSIRWITTIVELPPGEVVKTIMVGLSNVRQQNLEGRGIMEIDFIMLAARAEP
jgi:hypothetical protein